MEGLKNAIREAINSSNQLANTIEELEILKLNGELLLTQGAITQLKLLKDLHNKKIEYIEELKKALRFFEKINS